MNTFLNLILVQLKFTFLHERFYVEIYFKVISSHIYVQQPNV